MRAVEANERCYCGWQLTVIFRLTRSARLCERGRRGAGCRLCGGRQRSAGGGASARVRPACRRALRHDPVGRPFRPLPLRCLRHPGRDYRGDGAASGIGASAGGTARPPALPRREHGSSIYLLSPRLAVRPHWSMEYLLVVRRMFMQVVELDPAFAKRIRRLPFALFPSGMARRQ